MIHVNHPSEITPPSLKKLEMFKKKTGASILSQSVLLKGINDSVEILEKLFNKLIKFGIHPYYLYQNDPVPWAEDFTVPFEQAIEIWEKLKPKLSGLAVTARFVIDTPLGYGKKSLSLKERHRNSILNYSTILKTKNIYYGLFDFLLNRKI